MEPKPTRRRPLAAIVPIVIATVLVLADFSGRARALTPQELCEAHTMAAMGKRISLKLHCHAWAKAAQAPVDAGCLQRAEDQYVRDVRRGGPGCASAETLIAKGADADLVMSSVVGTVDTAEPPPAIDLSGEWESESIIDLTQAYVGTAATVVDIAACKRAGLCPNILIVECRSTITQEGDTLHHDGMCESAPASAVQLQGFTFDMSGPIDVRTGEWTVAGKLLVEPGTRIPYQADGVASPDGNGMTSVTIAGFDGAWTAFTTQRRVQ